MRYVVYEKFGLFVNMTPAAWPLVSQFCRSIVRHKLMCWELAEDHNNEIERQQMTLSMNWCSFTCLDFTVEKGGADMVTSVASGENRQPYYNVIEFWHNI